MLRITTQSTSQGITIVAEGALSGPWVQELQAQIQAARQKVALDLTGVTYMDAAGTVMVEQARDNGAVIKAASHFVALMLQKNHREFSDSSAGKEG